MDVSLHGSGEEPASGETRDSVPDIDRATDPGDGRSGDADVEIGNADSADPGVEIGVAHSTDPDVELDEARRAVLLRHARVIAETGNPDVPLTAAHAFRPPPDMTPAQGLGLLAAMLLVLLSGFASGALISALGVRASAALLLAIAVGASRGLGSGGAANTDGVPAIATLDRVLLFGAMVAAFALGSMTALMLLPAFVHLAVARLLLESTQHDVSLIEKGARISHPLAPAFIGPYCRKLTAVWGVAFAVSAGIIAMLALGGNVAAHRAWTGWQFWTLLGVFGAVEFFWRKAWFRYFGKGPFDRFLAGVFPPQNTERGRRSQAYLMRMRAELARLAEIERTARTEGTIESDAKH